jgi:chromosome segregation ATPase
VSEQLAELTDVTQGLQTQLEQTAEALQARNGDVRSLQTQLEAAEANLKQTVIGLEQALGAARADAQQKGASGSEQEQRAAELERQLQEAQLQRNEVCTLFNLVLAYLSCVNMLTRLSQAVVGPCG